MKNLKFFPIILSITFFIVGISISTVEAGRQDFTIVNNTGRTIYYLYCSATDTWEEDILHDNVIIDGESMKINFPPSQTARYWDLKVVFKDGSNWYWTGIDLFTYGTLKIDRKGTLYKS